jgi:hypothetical protein
MFDNQMVLQQAPQSALVWGFCAAGVCEQVSVSFNGATLDANVTNGIWRASLPPTLASIIARNITATSAGHTIRLTALFGDVWVS